MEGNLHIHFDEADAWRQRYFRLSGSTLTFTKTRSSSSVRGTYALDTGVSVNALSGTEVDCERKFCFELTSAAFTLLLEAPTQYEQTVWLNALRDVCSPPKGSVSLSAVARAAVASARSRALGSSPKGAANVLDSDRQMLQQSAVVGRRLDAHRRSEVGAFIGLPVAATTASISSSSTAGSAGTERSPTPADGEWIRCEGPNGPGSDFMWSDSFDLPGWGRIRQLTPANAQPYYFNQALGLTQWHRPAGVSLLTSAGECASMLFKTTCDILCESFSQCDSLPRYVCDGADDRNTTDDTDTDDRSDGDSSEAYSARKPQCGGGPLAPRD